jgi:phage-related protein
MSQNINAQAFTHGNDIYFNEGKYSPETTSGRHLIAHELTHTVQQGASVQRKPGISSAGKNTIQRSWLGDAWDAVGSAVSDAVEWAADQLDAAKDWLLEQLRDLVVEIPGYKLFTVVIGRDPITDQVVPRNGLNFIEAGLDLIPFGDQIKSKLEEKGALAEAGIWLDGQIELLNISPVDMIDQFRQWFNGLSITDVGRPREVLRDLINIFAAPIGRIINFIGNVAAKFLEILKNLALSELVDFIKSQTTTYPLLTVILGEDPITHEPVERNGMNILRGFILLHPQGDEQLRQMEETGSLQKAADWIDHAIATVTHAVQGILNAFSEAWNLITIESILHPIETFRQIYNLFAGPVGEILTFLGEVASMILKFIKDALLSRISAWARETRGYPLITVLLGKDPFTEEVVPRTAENIIRGFMSLMEGGLEKFNQLQETGAIQRMVTWIESAVANLNITWAYIKGLFISLWESMSLSDLTNPLAAFGRIIATFSEPIRRILAFIWEVIKALVQFGLEVMNFPFATINNIVNNAMQAFEDIKRDPIQFFLNLLAAVKKGFSQFFDNILTHLLNGLRDWLFGELGAAGIHPPADLSFRSILGLVLEVLGITMDNIWQRLALKIGAERVAQIRSAIDTLTGIWTFVKDVQERGPIAIWEYIQEQMSNLWDMVLGFIRNWIMTRIIERVTARLLSMLDPTGIMAVVNGFIAFYRAVQSFMEKLYEMIQIVDSFVAGVANIARGDISQAANFLENALARAVPVAIGFLANQVGLRGLGQKIGEMIEAARERVNGAIDWLIDRAMSIGGAILNMGRSAVAAITNWWQGRKEFTTPNGENHSLFFNGRGRDAVLMVASTIPSSLDERISIREAALQRGRDPQKEIKIKALEDAKKIKDTELTPLITRAEAQNPNNASTVNIQTEIDGVLTRIKDQLIIGGVNLVENLPLSNVTYTMNSGRAKHIVAHPLTKNPGNTAGAPADNSVLGADWDFVANRIYRDTVSSNTGRQIRVVDVHATHLLNARYHGPSTQWNLAIAPRGINNPMVAGENTADSPFNNEKILRYTTDVEYFSNTQPTDTSDPLFEKKKLEFLVAKSITLHIEQKNDNDDSYTNILPPTPYGINELPGANVALRTPTADQVLRILRDNKTSQSIEHNGKTYYKTIPRGQVVERLREVIAGESGNYVTINLANLSPIYTNELIPAGRVYISPPPMNETYVTND